MKYFIVSPFFTDHFSHGCIGKTDIGRIKLMDFVLYLLRGNS